MESQRITRFLFDREAGPSDRLIARWIFLRCLGGIYFSAFFSLAFQILGLNGSGGILPAADFLDKARGFGPLRFWYVPSLLWLNHSDHALTALVWVGLIASLLVIANVLPRPALIVCWLCFLSFVTTAQDFSQYQSDGMLLEAGLLALFIAPAGVLPGWGKSSLPARAAWYLLLWEWFRIYFESGMVKLASGDPTWRNLTAMNEYYQNGPLPTWIGWYLQHLPLWFHKATAGATLVMELILVWMAFLPRRWRLVCFAVVTVWQIGVIASANYAFLNYLVLVLAFLLLDDQILYRLVPVRFRGGLEAKTQPAAAQEESSLSILKGHAGSSSESNHPGQRLRSHAQAIQVAITTVLTLWIAYATTLEMVMIVWPAVPLPFLPAQVLEPFRVANQYGLFAVMTPHRYEVEFQGSNDGQTWVAYPFRYKPQALNERPRIYAPYQPRFDWNLWFASLEPWQRSPIVPLTEERLLEGERQTLDLFAADPFGGKPPIYVRAVLWQYWFSSSQEKRATGAWWRRQYLGTFAPTLRKAPEGKYGEVAVPELEGPPAE